VHSSFLNKHENSKDNDGVDGVNDDKVAGKLGVVGHTCNPNYWGGGR
jgi:hypothetical protein